MGEGWGEGVFLLIALTVAACASVPALEVASVRFADPPVGLPERAAQVERAASGLGWKVEERAPGRLRASLTGEGRPATVVAIALDPARFSVRYDDGREHATPEDNRRLAALRDAIVAQSSRTVTASPTGNDWQVSTNPASTSAGSSA